MSNYQPYNSNYGGYSEGGFDSHAQGNGGFNQGGSQGGSSQKTQQSNSITPVTIKEINEATQPVSDGSFVVHGLELSFVKFVGVLREVDSNNASAVSLKIEDGTGSITIRKWVDEGDQVDYETGTYVTVVGALREFSGKAQLQVSSLHKIEDYNEVVYHYLDAIKSYVEVNSGPAGGISHSNGAKSEGLFVSDHYNGGSKSSYDKVYDYIKDHAATMTDGVPLSMIIQGLRLSTEECTNIVASLCEDGKAYNGINDTSYLAV